MNIDEIESILNPEEFAPKQTSDGREHTYFFNIDGTCFNENPVKRKQKHFVDQRGNNILILSEEDYAIVCDFILNYNNRDFNFETCLSNNLSLEFYQSSCLNARAIKMFSINSTYRIDISK